MKRPAAASADDQKGLEIARRLQGKPVPGEEVRNADPEPLERCRHPRVSYCRGCGAAIAPGETLCGECLCEEDGE